MKSAWSQELKELREALNGAETRAREADSRAREAQVELGQVLPLAEQAPALHEAGAGLRDLVSRLRARLREADGQLRESASEQRRAARGLQALKAEAADVSVENTSLREELKVLQANMSIKESQWREEKEKLEMRLETAADEIITVVEISESLKRQNAEMSTNYTAKARAMEAELGRLKKLSSQVEQLEARYSASLGG